MGVWLKVQAEGRKRSGDPVIARDRLIGEPNPTAPIADIARGSEKAKPRWPDGKISLKVLLQLHKLLHLQQPQPFRRGIHRLMLERPGKIMRHKDGIDARRQRRVDV